MKLSDLGSNHDSYLRLERYVNEGSPSGFSDLNTPGDGFRARDEVESFQLPIFDCRHNQPINVGVSSVMAAGEVPIHPEMASEFEEESHAVTNWHLTAVPTSSGRTLSVSDKVHRCYLKVAYQRLLGRMTRPMTKEHVLSALEVSSTYESAIGSGRMPSSLHIYREYAGLYFSDGPLENWGYVERAVEPYPAGSFIEIPAFSMVAPGTSSDPSVLVQLVDFHPTLRHIDGFFRLVLKPLVELYFASVQILGLQPEAHAQNVVFLLDAGLVPVGVALRDMESVDKDIPLLDALGTVDAFTPMKYKCLYRDSYNYQIMHSFMYDFKLGKYLLAKLVDRWCAHTGYQAATVDELVRDAAHFYLKSLPGDFFPEGLWYDYEDVIHQGTGQRQYRQHPHPRFR